VLIAVTVTRRLCTRPDSADANLVAEPEPLSEHPHAGYFAEVLRTAQMRESNLTAISQ
jgi:hypothetical protein